MLTLTLASTACAETQPPSPGPWDFTLDTVIAALGAIVTIILTILALRQTSRANRLQKDAHDSQKKLDEHQRRFRLQQAMLSYIGAVEVGRHAAEEHDAMVMSAVENGFGHDAPELEWAGTEAHDLADAYREVERDAEGNPVDQATYYAHAAALTSMRRRLAHWVETADYPKNKTWSAASPAAE